MLAAAPLFDAQLGALEIRKEMMLGDVGALRNLRLGATMTVGQVLKQLSKAPPIAILKLCNRATGDAIMESSLQHGEDLDFTQDVLTTVGNRTELNPALHAVLTAFNRRRNTARFKSGQQNMDLDCIRFAHTATHNDSDVQAKNRQEKSR